jgi:hypothetical protein
LRRREPALGRTAPESPIGDARHFGVKLFAL